MAAALSTPTTSASTGLQFLVSTGKDTPNPERRRLIRSHVMKGKNKGKIHPPRHPAPPSLETTPTLLGLSSSGSGADLLPSAIGTRRKDLRYRDNDDLKSRPVDDHHQMVMLRPPPILRKFGSDMATVPFADDVEPGALDVVLRFSSIAKRVLFPLESCIFFDKRAETWIAPLTIDPAFLHAMVLAANYYFDIVLPRKAQSRDVVNSPIVSHYAKALRYLRERFEGTDERSKLSDTTAIVVSTLAGQAFIMGEFSTTRHHLEGVRRIISLRGGIAVYGVNPKPLIEILRCDLGLALSQGTQPVFFNDAFSKAHLMPYPNIALLFPLPLPPGTERCVPSASAAAADIDDVELAQAWKVMADFCAVINIAAATAQRISTQTFLDTMASVLYRLFDMRFASDCSSELVRLGLLSFATTVFFPWNELGLSYPHLASQLRACIVQGMPLSGRISTRLAVWLLVVGSISVLDESDHGWARPMLRVEAAKAGANSWSEIRELLREHMWIGLVHDEPGRVLLDSVMNSRDGRGPAG